MTESEFKREKRKRSEAQKKGMFSEPSSASEMREEKQECFFIQVGCNGFVTTLRGAQQLTGDLTVPLDLSGNLNFEKRTEILNLIRMLILRSHA